MILFRYADPHLGPRWAARLDAGTAPLPGFTLDRWLNSATRSEAQAILDSASAAVTDNATPAALAPLESQEVWAAGVTYERSREARQEEAADGGDVYARVYRAQRPELFYKGSARTVVGPGAPVAIRADSDWNVPEPELGLVFTSSLALAGLTIGNDMSSRSIEGENPLYLPQAKVYDASCALGPGIVPFTGAAFPQTAIRMRIVRGGVTLFSGETHTDRIRRTIADLADHLGRSNTFPHGVILLTGTGIVPPAEVTLQAGDQVDITIDGIGQLSNPVIRI